MREDCDETDDFRWCLFFLASLSFDSFYLFAVSIPCKGLGIEDCDELPLDELDLCLRFFYRAFFELLPDDDEDECDDRLLDELDEEALRFLDCDFLSCIFLCSPKSFSSSSYKFCSSLSLELLELLEDLDFLGRVDLLKSPSKAGFVSGPASNTSLSLSSGFLASYVRLGR